jgi:hypothetical protein
VSGRSCGQSLRICVVREARGVGGLSFDQSIFRVLGAITRLFEIRLCFEGSNAQPATERYPAYQQCQPGPHHAAVTPRRPFRGLVISAVRFIAKRLSRKDMHLRVPVL